MVGNSFRHKKAFSWLLPRHQKLTGTSFYSEELMANFTWWHKMQGTRWRARFSIEELTPPSATKTLVWPPAPSRSCSLTEDQVGDVGPGGGRGEGGIMCNTMGKVLKPSRHNIQTLVLSNWNLSFPPATSSAPLDPPFPLRDGWWERQTQGQQAWVLLPVLLWTCWMAARRAQSLHLWNGHKSSGISLDPDV